MSDNQSPNNFRKPERFLAELLKKSAKGQFHEKGENVPFLYRATVIAVDTVGGQLENPDGKGTITHTVGSEKITVNAVIGPRNPKNSIKARVISDGFDQFISAERLVVFWPFFPEHVSVPIKPGEHVYVIFEDTDYEHGLWVTKIAGHEGVNYYRGQDSFKAFQKPPLSDLFDNSKDANSEEENLNTDESAGESHAKSPRLLEKFK